MKTKMTLAFYQNLGKLFYAMAATDGDVKPLEITKLKTCVKNQWLDVDDLEDTFGTDAAYQIEIVFDWLNNNEKPNVESYFNDFINYKNKQSHIFTKDIKCLIIKTATEIAYAFSGINKSELTLLAKLDLELKKT